jgi:hypothetical protein
VLSVSSSELLVVLPVAATMNCADNSGAKNLFIIAAWLSEAVLIDSQLALLEMLSCAHAKKVMTRSERNFTQLSSLDKEDHGEDPMELIFIAKIMLVLLLTIKAKQKAALLLVQSLNKHQNFGQRFHLTQVQSFDCL